VVAPHDEARAIPVPPARSFSILPAATVLIIAVGTVGFFAVLNAFDSTQTTTTTIPAIVVGGLPADPSTTVFTGFVEPGLPPADIATALVAPVTTRRVALVHTGGGGAGNYDRAVTLRVNASRPELLGFYRAQLDAQGWRQFSAGAGPHGGAQILFSKAGGDGWFWEAGVVANSSGAARTTYTYRLLQASDVS
jgi:hypothetical protein